MDLLKRYDYIIASLIASILNIITIYIFDKSSKYKRLRKDYLKIFFTSLLIFLMLQYILKKYNISEMFDITNKNIKSPKIKGGNNFNELSNELTTKLDTGLPNF